jgi:hypothetical protein
MAVQLGSGEYTFEVNENWAKLPTEITLGDCAAVGVDRQNKVYAFNRGEHPVAVFDAEGNLLRTWVRECSAARTACIWVRTIRSI